MTACEGPLDTLLAGLPAVACAEWVVDVEETWVAFLLDPVTRTGVRVGTLEGVKETTGVPEGVGAPVGADGGVGVGDGVREGEEEEEADVGTPP